jgi:hypothetical protein
MKTFFRRAAILLWIAALGLNCSKSGDSSDDLEFAEPGKALEIGFVEGNRFTSPAFNFSMDLPNEWVSLTGDQNNEVLQMGADELFDKNTQNLLKDSLKQTYALFQYAQYPLGSAVVFNPNINTVASLVPPNTALTNLEMARETAVALPQLSPSIALKTSEFEIDIDGFRVGAFEITMIMNNMQLEQRHILFESNGYVINVVLSYVEQAQLDLMMDFVRTIKKLENN